MKWEEIQPLLQPMRTAHLHAEEIRKQGGSTRRTEADIYIGERAPFDGEDALEALEEVPQLLLLAEAAGRLMGYTEGLADRKAGKALTGVHTLG